MTTRRGVGQDCIGSEGQGFPGLVVKKGTRRLFVGRDGRRTGAGEGILGAAKGSKVVQEDDALDADTTIRLIGGGGVTGTVDDLPGEEQPLHNESTSDKAEVASITSLTSNDSIASKSKSHVKKKSISAGLKKLGKLGSGVRTSKSDKEKDSVSSQVA